MTARPEVRPRLGTAYWRLFSATTVTNLGDGLMAVAVVWLASSLTRDAALIALVGLASRLPWLLLSLPAGVLADRFDRRLLVAWMNALQAVVLGGFAVAVLAVQGSLPSPEELASGAPAPDGATWLLVLLCLASFLIGCAEVVRDNAAQTLLPSVVDKSLLERANGRMWGAETAMNNFVGPPLGGVLVAAAIAAPFFINAGLLAVGAALVFAMAGSVAPRERATGPIAWRAEIGEGFRWLWDHHLLRALALLLGASNLLAALNGVVLVLFAQEVLGLFDGWQFGLAITGTAVGAIAGSLLADRITAVVPPGTALLGSLVGMGLTTAALGLVSSAVLFWLVGALMGVLIVVWNVVTVSLRQRIIPDHLLGRVNSVYRLFGWGTIGIGTLLGGLLVTLGEPLLGREWALRTPFVLGGVLTLMLLAYAVPRVNNATIAAAHRDAEAG